MSVVISLSVYFSLLLCLMTLELIIVLLGWTAAWQDGWSPTDPIYLKRMFRESTELHLSGRERAGGDVHETGFTSYTS